MKKFKGGKHGMTLVIPETPLESVPLEIEHIPLGVLKVDGKGEFAFATEDLRDLGFIGKGHFGVVKKMSHAASGMLMAVKISRIVSADGSSKAALKDLDVIAMAKECPFIVQYYGAIIAEDDCWICMELMDTSLDTLYKTVYKLNSEVPEDILGEVALAVSVWERERERLQDSASSGTNNASEICRSSTPSSS
jgi:Protein kinase domain